MERTTCLIGILISLLIIQAGGQNDYDYRRALKTLLGLREASTYNRRDLIDCLALGEDCRGMPKCCGSLQCYWPKGYSLFKSGECVTCVRAAGKCQRDSQCCTDLQCNKGNVLWVDGNCEIYRSSGPCYRKGQCVNGCSNGECY